MREFRRRLITIAIPDGVGSTAFKAGTDAQLAAIEAWWCASALGDRAFAPNHFDGIDSRRDIEAAIHETGLRQLGPSDVALIYVTGHGRGSPSGRHYLLLPDTPHERLVGHGYPTVDVVAAALDSDIRHVLVVVNSCFSGLLEVELAALRKDLIAERRDLTSLSVFTSADFDEMPRAREFAELLRRLHDWLRTRAQYTAPFLSFDEFEKELIDAARREPRLLEPRRVWRTGPSSEPSPCVPNPGYQPPEDVVTPALRQVASNATELDYWLDRASGRLTADDPGWYFSGRRELTGHVARFLADGEGTLIVTGAAGTGKSAVIARAVTLSDPEFRNDLRYRHAVTTAPPETVPPIGAVDVAILARNKDVDEIVDQILAVLGRSAETDKPRRLRDYLRQGRSVHTIVVDGLDEARNPSLLVIDVLGPLARLTDADGRPAVRLVVGVRSTTRSAADDSEPELVDLLRSSVGDVAELRTDGPESLGAITEYVESLLDGKPASYRTEIAAIVADRVAPSFLDARLAGQRLRESDTLQRADDSRWLSSLDEGTIGLLRQDLLDAATPRNSATELLAVLQATAFALGAGLPWADIWPAIASALLGEPAASLDSAIAHVVGGRLCGYLARDSEDGRGVYRPAHERLAQVLRDDPERILDGLSVSEGRVPQGRIAERLGELAHPIAGLPPHPYLRRHLADHASLGGVLDDFTVPPRFLPWDTGGHIRGLLGLPVTDVGAKSALTNWARIEPFLGDADLPSREVSLRFSQVATNGISVQPVSDAHHTIALRPRWARWAVLGNVLADLASPVVALAALQGPNQGVLLATADREGTVQIWDPTTGRAVGVPLPGGATALAAFSGPNQRSLLAVGDKHGGIRVWDPATGALISNHESAHTSSINALCTFHDGGGTLLASASQDHTVRIWSQDTGDLIAELRGHTGGVRAVTAFVTQRGAARLATASWDQTVRIWEPRTGRQVGQPLTGHDGAVNTVLALPSPEQAGTLLVTAGTDETVRVWDPGTGRQTIKPIEGRGGGAHAVAAYLFDRHRWLVTVNADATVQRWDASSGVPIGAPLIGTTRWVNAMTTFTTQTGRLLLTAGTRDGTVQVWHLGTTGSPLSGRQQVTERPERVNCITTFRDESGGRHLVEGGDESVRVRNPDTGESTRTLPARRGPVWANAALIGADGRTLLATGSAEPAIRIWDLRSGEVVRELVGHVSGVPALTTVPGRSGRHRLASGSRDGTVRIWDPETGTETIDPLTGHADWVNALVSFQPPDHPPLLASGGGDYFVRVWDPSTGRLLREMTGHNSSVRSLATFTSADGPTLLASGSQVDDAVWIWNPLTGEPVGTLPGHPGGVNAIAAFTGPRNRVLLATGGDDRTVRIWDLRARRELIRLVVAAPVTALHVVRATASGGRSTPGYLAIGGAGGIAIVELTPAP